MCRLIFPWMGRVCWWIWRTCQKVIILNKCLTCNHIPCTYVPGNIIDWHTCNMAAICIVHYASQSSYYMIQCHVNACMHGCNTHVCNYTYRYTCRVDLSTATVRTLFFPYWISLVAGPVAFTCAILHIALSSRYPTVGKIMESIVSLSLLIIATMH